MRTASRDYIDRRFKYDSWSFFLEPMIRSARHFSPNVNLKPVRVDGFKRVIAEGDSTKPRWWRVNVGKRLTGTAKIRRFFKTEKQAKEFITDVVNAAKERGRLAFAIPQMLAVEAMELAKQLAPHDATLTEAVKFYLRHVGTKTGRTMEQLIPEYLRTKADAKYRRAQGISLRLFARDFGQKAINTIFPPQIDKWLQAKNWKPLNTRNYIRDLSMFFRWAKLRDYLSENPCDKIRRPKVQLAAPEIFTVEETRRILETALANPDLGLLPMLAVCFFSGTRIYEVGKMNWEMFDWDEGEIRLPGDITKTGNPRNIDILDALRAWVGVNPPKVGQIVSSTNLRLRRQRLLSLAGVGSKRNALRHSFASYHAAKFRDPGGLQLLLGQRTPSVLFQHYIAAVKRSDAIAFFNLRPSEKIFNKYEQPGGLSIGGQHQKAAA